VIIGNSASKKQYSFSEVWFLILHCYLTSRAMADIMDGNDFKSSIDGIEIWDG
jgi:hypothetical protein